GTFPTEDGAAMVMIGQPDMDRLELDNPVRIPNALSMMTHQRWNARVLGLTEYDRASWPDNVPLLYYAYHVMVGLGTIFTAIMLTAAALLRKGWLFAPRMKPVLWVLMLAAPLPFVAN